MCCNSNEALNSMEETVNTLSGKCKVSTERIQVQAIKKEVWTLMYFIYCEVLAIGV